MLYYRKIIILAIVGFTFLQPASAASFNTIQAPADTFANHLKQALTLHYQRYPKEKVFLHLGKQNYYSGETLWFKAYVTAYGKTSDLSKIVYARLTDTAGNLIVQQQLQLENGAAKGNIDFSPKLKSGWYQLTAFTSWMLNFEDAGFFHQRIYIRDPLNNAVPAGLTAPKHSFTVEFFPEGGDIINNTINNVAFAVTDQDGRPVGANGIIKDSHSQVITAFSTAHAGLGDFTIEASPAETYTATCHFPDGSTKAIILPKAKDKGICLQVSQSGSQVELKIAYNGEKKQFGHCLLAACQDNGKFITYPLDLKLGFNIIALQKSLFSTGILRLTIFDTDGAPQAERVVFVNLHDLHISGVLPLSQPGPKTDSWSFAMQIKDQTGNGAKGSFSVAVTDSDVPLAAPNIFSGLLLSPELNGRVNDAGYYFTSNEDSLARQLDLVMLTSGWRHFVWAPLLAGKEQPLMHPVEKLPFIAGTVAGFDSTRWALAGNQVKLMIWNSDSTRFIGNALPDHNGKFILKDFVHNGLSDVYLQVTDKKNHLQPAGFKILPSIGDSLRLVKGPPFTNRNLPAPSVQFDSLARIAALQQVVTEGTMLNTVNIKGRKTQPVDKLITSYVSAAYQSGRDFTLDLVNNPTINMGVLNYIKGRFPNLQIIGDGDDPNVRIIYRTGLRLESNDYKPPGANQSFEDQMNPGGGNPLPYFYINETPVSFAEIRTVLLENVALIRFVPPPVGFAPFNGGNVGALMIYTKTPGDEIRKMTGNTLFTHFIFNGFSVTRAFGTTVNQGVANRNSIDKDKELVFWNPEVNPNHDGQFTINFKGPETAKRLHVVLQGMDNEGRLCYYQGLLMKP